MNSTGAKEASPHIPAIDGSSSDDDEAETDAILASLLTKLDDLERQQHETITYVHDQFQNQRQAVDILRKSVRKAESIIHQKRFSRQRAKIRRLKEFKTTGALISHNAIPISTIKSPETPQGKKSVPTEKSDANAKTKEFPNGSKTFTGTPVFTSSTLKATLIGGSSNNNHDEDIVMMSGDEDDNHPESASPLVSPAAPVAPPMETPEAHRASKKPTTVDGVTDSMNGEAAERAAEVEEKPRPVQKMRPTRGKLRGRGTTARGPTDYRKPQGGSAVGSTRSRSNSHGTENVAAPPSRSRGMGTAMRSRPFRRGAIARSASSTEENDTSEIPSTSKAPARPSGSSSFIAINTPQPPTGAGPSTWLGNRQLEVNLPLSSFAAGAGAPRAIGSPSKSLPPPRSRAQVASSTDSAKKGSKPPQSRQDLPAEPVLFSYKDLRMIFGGGNPGSIMANITQEGRLNAVVKYPSYICLSPDAHFDPPGTMCDNAEMLDIDGEEDPLDSDTIYPVWKKIGKLWMYCGDYTQGSRRTVSVQAWKSSNEAVRKYWAKKIQESEWGREFLVIRGFRRHGEIKNNSVAEILGYFAIDDNKKGLRLSATTLNFKTFNRPNYDLMVARIETLYPTGLSLAPISDLKSNNLSARPRTSFLAAGSNSPEGSKTVSSPREKKRRRTEAVAEEKDDPETPLVPQRHPVLVGGDRSRRVSRNDVNYRIAPLSEFEGELQRTTGKGKNEVIELSEEEGSSDHTQEEEEGEEEKGGEGEKEDENEEDDDDDDDDGEEEEDGSGDEGEMVID